MVKTQEALDMAVRGKLQYQALANEAIDPAKKMHYNTIATVFDLASYDIAQLAKQYKDQQ